MAEYIEREAVLEKAEYDGNYRLVVPADTVKSLPAADVVPVVMCKDCKHCGFCGEATNLAVMGYYGYCSRGER